MIILLKVIYIFLFVYIFYISLRTCMEYKHIEPVTWADFFTCVFLALIAPIALLIFGLWFMAGYIDDDEEKRN